MRISLLAAAALLLPVTAYAAGSDDSTPPKITQTAQDCVKGQIFDEKTKSCLDAKSDLFDDDRRYDAVRELAYDGQYDRALLVLASMRTPQDSRVLTYRGFIARKTGQIADAMGYYSAALEADADNILARSYLGQAHVVLGDLDAARIELSEIRIRGGRNSWAEHSLKMAIASGRGFSY